MILTYSIKHRRDFKQHFIKAQQVADYAVLNKSNKTMLSSKYVKHIGLPSAISNQILRKYSGKTIKSAKKVHLIVPGQGIGYDQITNIVSIKPLKIKFRWNCGRPFLKINQIEVTDDKFFLCVSFTDVPMIIPTLNKMLTIDLNCGLGRSIAVCTDHTTNKLLTFGKQGPNLRKKYFKLRQKCQQIGDYTTLKKLKNKEQRVMRNLDHQISNQIVNYAQQNDLKIVMEDLKGIRTNRRTGNGSAKAVNRIINSWSFYRLQSFIDYKSHVGMVTKPYGIPVEYVPPHYTSQHCNYCGTIGSREGINFVCLSRHCQKYNVRQNSDINATYNIRKRSLGLQ